MASPLPLLPKSIRDARLSGGQPDTELINWAQALQRSVQQLQAGGGLPALIAAIANVSPSANEFLRFTGAATVEALTADEVTTALALVAADISDLGTAATGDIGVDVQGYDAELAELAALSFSNGDILYYNAGLQRLAKGSDSQVLTLASGIPSWADAAGGGSSVAFAALMDSGGADDQLNVTGDGTWFNPTFSDITKNVGSGWDGSVFTAPTAGLYCLTLYYSVNGGSSADYNYVRWTTDLGQTFNGAFKNQINNATHANGFVCGIVLAEGEVATPGARVQNGSKNYDHTYTTNSHVSGFLVA